MHGSPLLDEISGCINSNSFMTFRNLFTVLLPRYVLIGLVTKLFHVSILYEENTRTYIVMDKSVSRNFLLFNVYYGYLLEAPLRHKRFL